MVATSYDLDDNSEVKQQHNYQKQFLYFQKEMKSSA